MVSIILLNCTGCKNSSENEQASALEYLEERYPDDEFELISNYGGGAGIDGHTYIFSSKKYPNNKVHVASDGDTFRDTYLSIKYNKHSKELLDSVISELVGDDYFLGVSDMVYCTADPDISFDEYKKNVNMSIVVITDYMLAENDRAEFEKKLYESFKKNEITIGRSSFFFDKGTDQYKEVKNTKSNKDYNASKSAYCRCSFSVLKNDEDFYVDWDEYK